MKEHKEDINYLLNLPEPIKKHLVFHISLLEKTDFNTPLQTAPLLLDQDDEEYDVKEILNYQKVKEKWKYLIKWLNYNHSEDT